MSVSALINDGYLLPFEIPGRLGLHPQILGQYRPALYAQRLEFLRRADQAGEDKAKWCAQLVAEHVKLWNVTDQEGGKASVSVENIIRLHPSALDSMLSIILGYTPGQQEQDQKN